MVQLRDKPAVEPPAVDDCCAAKGEELTRIATDAGRRKILVAVLAINLVMFAAEFGAGLWAGSTALLADSADMLGDAGVYVLSLYVLDRSLRWRAGAALVKGLVILAFGLLVLVQVGFTLRSGAVPTYEVMGVFGLAALTANLVCLSLLWRVRAADVNMSSTFECSRNDVIANVGVLIAAAAVWFTGAAWPDILVGLAIAALFLRSARSVIAEAWPQFRASRGVTESTG